MSNPNLTVREALSAPDPNAKPGTPDAWTTLQQQVRDQMKGIKWVATMPDVAEMLGELFDIPIPGLLISSWRKADELLKLLKESEQRPEEVMYLELAEHTINRKIYPYIEVRIENLPARDLDFMLDLHLRLKGIVLRIQAGQIQEILSAQCEVGGDVEFLNHTVLRKEFTPVNLPGSIRLSEDDGQRKHQAPAEI
jgi:hypothetical protein